MQEILVKIPPTQSKKLRIERFFDRPLVSGSSEQWKKKPKRYTAFTHKFVIEDSSEPITVNLDNIPRDVIPLELAKEEIQKSYDKGFEEGQMSEMALAKAEMNNFADKMRTLEGVTRDFDEKTSLLLNYLHDSVLEISRKVALHIMRAESLTNSDAIISRVGKIIEQSKDSEIVSITLNPNTYQNIKMSNNDILENSNSNVLIIEDENLELSDCIIKTDSGFLEARIEDELDNMMTKLKDQFQKAKITQRDKELEILKEGKPEEDV